MAWFWKRNADHGDLGTGKEDDVANSASAVSRGESRHGGIDTATPRVLSNAESQKPVHEETLESMSRELSTTSGKGPPGGKGLPLRPKTERQSSSR